MYLDINRKWLELKNDPRHDFTSPRVKSLTTNQNTPCSSPSASQPVQRSAQASGSTSRSTSNATPNTNNNQNCPRPIPSSQQQGTVITSGKMTNHLLFFSAIEKQFKTRMKTITLPKKGSVAYHDSNLFLQMRTSYNKIRGWRRFLGFTAISEMKYVQV